MAENDQKQETFQFTIEQGQKVELPFHRIGTILDDRIFRIDDGGDRRVRVASGHYGDPFKVWHREQDIYHGFSGPYDAFRQTVHARVWEGVPVQPNDFSSEGERQKLLALLGKERTLQLLASDSMMNGPEREAFERLARSTARRMGIPRNEAKRRIMELLIQVATMNGEDSEKLFKDMLGLTETRLTDVGDIGKSVNWRSAVLLREIHWQQAIMNNIGQVASELITERPMIAVDLVARSEHLRKVDNLIETLRKIKDRPFYGQAARNISDLTEYHLLVRDYFPESGLQIKRVSLTSTFPGYVRELQAVMFLLGNSRAYSGSKREALEDRTHQMLMQLKRQIGDPERADVLNNNPLWAALGYINDALARLHGARSWDTTKVLLRKAIEAF